MKFYNLSLVEPRFIKFARANFINLLVNLELTLQDNTIIMELAIINYEIALENFIMARVNFRKVKEDNCIIIIIIGIKILFLKVLGLWRLHRERNSWTIRYPEIDGSFFRTLCKKIFYQKILNYFVIIILNLALIKKDENLIKFYYLLFFWKSKNSKQITFFLKLLNKFYILNSILNEFFLIKL